MCSLLHVTQATQLLHLEVSVESNADSKQFRLNSGGLGFLDFGLAPYAQ